MFCKFGSAELIRPVLVSVCLNIEWTRPEGETVLSKPSTYVLFSFNSWRWVSTSLIIGCSLEILARLSASVLKPVLVLPRFGSFNLSKSTEPSCAAELTLNGMLSLYSKIAESIVSISVCKVLPNSISLATSICTPLISICTRTYASGISTLCNKNNCSFSLSSSSIFLQRAGIFKRPKTKASESNLIYSCGAR